ncbi:hypothetical protein EDD40_1565 [Saccharothrix texasensis]|uniref:Uncharacterized protein n=1 Tax=Saccharothrix texasensis TaxID=103734 RepID=A0A3N1H1A1_9PSEU|nr:hypothetical protein EDD40_1565 [Saccharothrix texasensis]
MNNTIMRHGRDDDDAFDGRHGSDATDPVTQPAEPKK